MLLDNAESASGGTRQPRRQATAGGQLSVKLLRMASSQRTGGPAELLVA
jgi:hypothetical protein